MDVKWFMLTIALHDYCKASILLVIMIIAYLKFIRFPFCVPDFRLKVSFMGMNIADGMC